MNWPNKRLRHAQNCNDADNYEECTCGFYDWNNAIDACKSAFEKQGKLVSLDELSVAKELWYKRRELYGTHYEPWEKLPENSDARQSCMADAKIIFQRFGAPEQEKLVPLEKAKIYELLDKYKFAQGYVEFVNELCQTYGAPEGTK